MKEKVYSREVNDWFSTVLHREVMLIVKSNEKENDQSCEREGKKEKEEGKGEREGEKVKEEELTVNVGKELNFPNESQFLGVNLASVTAVNRALEGESLPSVLPNRFRPNILIDFPEAFAEDSWKEIRIGKYPLTVLGPCTRCKMINIDQESGEVDTQPYLLLSKTQSFQNRVCGFPLISRGVTDRNFTDFIWSTHGNESRVL